MFVDAALYAQLLSSANDRPRILMHHDTNSYVDNTYFFPKHRSLHVDGSISQKTDYVLPDLRQSRNSEVCPTQSQYTDTGPISQT